MWLTAQGHRPTQPNSSNAERRSGGAQQTGAHEIQAKEKHHISICSLRCVVLPMRKPRQLCFRLFDSELITFMHADFVAVIRFAVCAYFSHLI